jgi:hypothetical protein
MFIVVLTDGETWDIGGYLVEIDNDEYNRLNACGDLSDIRSKREILLRSVVEDDGETFGNVMSEDLDPVIKSHRRELVNRVIGHVALGNVDEVLRIVSFLKK